MARDFSMEKVYVETIYRTHAYRIVSVDYNSDKITLEHVENWTKITTPIKSFFRFFEEVK